MSVRGVSGGSNRTVRIRQDGKVQLALTPGTRSATGPPVRPDSEIMAAGKTTAQLQREIAAVLSERYPSAQVAVTLLSRGSREELQREFNNAHTEAAARRSNSR